MKETIQQSLLALLCFAGVAALAGCENDLTPPTGVTVSGQVRYASPLPEGLKTPWLEVDLYASYDPAPPFAHGSFASSAQELAEGIPFRLEFIEPYRYYLVAKLVDGDDPADTGIALGSWPDLCALETQSGSVVVEKDPVADLDIELWGNAGLDDPCGPASKLPDAGVGDAGSDIGDGDRYALFGQECDPTAASPCGPGAPVCSGPPGATTGYCTANGCLEDPTVCPPTWTCFDASVFSPTAGSSCMRP